MSDDLIAQFLAKGGKVTKVAPEVRAIEERDMYDALRGKGAAYKNAAYKYSDNDLIEQRIVKGDVVYNGLGEIIGRL